LAGDLFRRPAAKKKPLSAGGADNGFWIFFFLGNSDHYQPFFPVVDKDYYEAGNAKQKVDYGDRIVHFKSREKYFPAHRPLATANGVVKRLY
jgi:hypothetical protein